MARSIRSFAFFVFAFLALVNATPSVSHGFISAIDRQTSPYFLSFRADLTDIMPLANGVNVYYSIGISAGSAEIVSWTQINTPQAVNTIVETFATPLPDDYAIYINVKTVDTNNGNAETVYSSASLKVGNRLSSDPTCAAIFNPVGTSTVSPPQPAITIEYDNTQQLFHFEIGAKYLLQGYTWVIDFAPFTGDYTKGTKGLAATNCENRQTADLTGRNFAEFWNAAPAADYTGALNSKNYLAYRIGSSSPKWTVSSDGCDKVTYTTPGFSFADLLSCTQADGNTPSIVRTIVGNSIQYNGTLYVTAVKAVDPLDHTAGFQTVQFTMPFFVSFSVSSTSISSGTDNNIFAFSISSLYIQADGNLAMSLSTNAMNNGFYLTNPSVDNEPNNVDLAVANPAPKNTQQQVWTFKTATPKTDYSGPYAISFTRTDGTAQTTVTAQFTLSLSVTSSYNNNGLTLPTVLSFWDSTAFDGNNQKTTYTSLDTIYVKSTVTIQNNQDQNTYANSIYNVWLCYTVDGSAPVYNPTNNQLGCTAQTWNIRPLSRLVLDGTVTTGVLENQFATTLYNAIQGLSSVNSGVTFKAAPLATLRTGAFWIQIESKINLPAKKRSLLAEQASSHEIQSFAISADATTDVPKIPIASSAAVAQVCTAAVALFGGLLLL